MSSGSVNYRIQSLQHEIKLLKQIIFNNNQKFRKELTELSDRIDKLENEKDNTETLVLIEKSSTNLHS